MSEIADHIQTLTDMTGRTVLVTGASSGLGMRFATVLASSGAKVALAARRLDRLEVVVAQIKANGGHAIALATDVTDESSVVAAYDVAEATLSPIHTVIANAGINAQGLATNLTVEDFDRIMAVNVRGAFLTAREGARRMVAAGSRDGQWARIVLISSIGAHSILPGLAAYCASKAAVTMMGRCLARECSSPVVASTINLPRSEMGSQVGPKCSSCVRCMMGGFELRAGPFLRSAWDQTLSRILTPPSAASSRSLAASSWLVAAALSKFGWNL